MIRKLRKILSTLILVIASLCVLLYLALFAVVGASVWWAEHQCNTNAFVRTGDKAKEVALPVALVSYAPLFNQQSITTPAELLAAYPDCCRAYEPNIYPPPKESEKPHWAVEINVTSPCTQRPVRITVMVNRCGMTDDFISSHADVCRPS